MVESYAFAKNTNATYEVGTKAFLRFALFYCLLAVMPPSDGVLAAFVVFQAGTCKYSTIKTYLFGVRSWVLDHGHDFAPFSQRRIVYKTLKGVQRIFGGEVTRKLAVTPALLLQMRDFLCLSEFNDVMIWAAMLVAFYGFFRKDNITVGKASAFNPRANLTIGDFVVKGGVLWIRVKHSKTIQFQERYHWVPLVAMPGNILCPVTAVKAVLKLHGPGSPDRPMFLWRKGGRASPLTHGVFVAAFKHLVAKCGLNWSRYSGHSFRRGGATYAFNLGVCPEFIKMLGDWKSDAYLLYDETTFARRLELPVAMANAIRGGRLDNGPRME